MAQVPLPVASPSIEDMSRCVHCGFCLQQCPTYLQLGMETDSPRGRIHMLRAVVDGRAEPAPALTGHLDLCLQCRACETACPSSVRFGRIMEAGRAMLIERRTAPRSWRVRVWFLRLLLPYPRRITAIFALLRLYQRTGLKRLLRATRLLRLLPSGLAEAETMLPTLPAVSFNLIRSVRTPSTVTKRAALLTGCVMPHLYPRTHDATLRVLARHGVEVVDVPGQRCCGALSLHAGDRTTGRDLARQNIDAFLDAGVDTVIVNAAGCGATLKEYGDLLDGDVDHGEQAHRFSARVRDVTEFLCELGLQPPRARLDLRVTYQDSCHLIHGQKVRSAPREILAAIPGLELVEMPTPDRCCGSAGIYSFAQRDMSLRVLDDKIRDVAATKAPVIATANPGCMMQLEAGLRRHGRNGRVVHVVELLDQAYQAEEVD